MSNTFLGTFVVSPSVSAQTVRVGRITLEVAAVPGCSAVQIFVHEQQVEDAAPEPAQKHPLQSENGEALPGDGGVGPVGPFSDALPQEREVVEGVEGKADGYLTIVFAIIDLYSRSLLSLGDAMDLLVAIRKQREE
jgi:hypothetical protein